MARQNLDSKNRAGSEVHPLSDESFQKLQEILEAAVEADSAHQQAAGHQLGQEDLAPVPPAQIGNRAGGEVQDAVWSYRQQLRRLLAADPDSIPSVLGSLAQIVSQLPVRFLDHLGAETDRVLAATSTDLEDDALSYVEELLLRGSPAGRWHWLAVLARCQSPAGLDLFVRELLESTPSQPTDVLIAFSPLMQSTDFDPDWMFPELFAGIHQTDMAPVIFDFANFCFREGISSEHPAIDRGSEVLALLQGLVKRMKDVEADPTSWSSDPKQISKMISDSVALIVSLCDALALMEWADAIETFRDALQIRHRRIRTEAAFALAKFGEADGAEALLELVHEPVSRLRVIEYAQELGLGDRIPDEATSDVARAESELALWLSQPAQMGMPPTEMTLLDRRVLYWPSFDAPVECFLFRFEYRSGENLYSNVALVGPTVHAFATNIESLSFDDEYAAFAGWQAEHEEIAELDMQALSPHRKTDLFKLERKLSDYGCCNIESQILGLFFGDVVAVVRCDFEDQPCFAFSDGTETATFPIDAARPISAHEVFCIYKGRRLLQAFNP